MKSNITSMTTAMMLTKHWPDLTDSQAEQVVSKLWEDGSFERLLTKYLTCGAWEQGSFESEMKSLCENSVEALFPVQNPNDPYSEGA